MSVVARSYFDTIGNSADVGVECLDPSLAVQAAKEECDINNIINRYMRTGELPEQRAGVYADLSEIGDLRTAMEQVQRANALFEELPATVRQYFDNDPRKLVEFSEDNSNYAKAVELGLIIPAAPVEAKADPSPAKA